MSTNFYFNTNPPHPRDHIGKLANKGGATSVFIWAIDPRPTIEFFHYMDYYEPDRHIVTDEEGLTYRASDFYHLLLAVDDYEYLIGQNFA